MASGRTSLFPAESGVEGAEGADSPVLRDPDWTISIGGLSVLERAARSARRCAARALVLHRDGAEKLSTEDAPSSTESSGACLVFVRAALVDPTAIAAIIRLSEGSPGVTGIAFRGSPAQDPAAYWVRASSPVLLTPLLAAVVTGHPRAFPAARATITLPEGVFERVDSPAARAAAAAALRRSLVKPTDGFFATWIDRRLSTRWSMRLAATSWTPNAITVAALALALAGAALLAVPTARWSAAGALLFWLSTILDGCDGEVARLRFEESPGGARLDLFCDNIALVAVFAAIFTHVYLERPGPTVLWLGLASLIGMVGCMATEYFRILKPRIDSGASSLDAAPQFDAERVRWYERLASRDFAYVLPLLALFGRLSWLVWGTAIGVNAFFLALTFYVLRSRR